MPFGITKTLTTFCTLMNKVLAHFLDRFVVVYRNDIVIIARLWRSMWDTCEKRPEP